MTVKQEIINFFTASKEVLLDMIHFLIVFIMYTSPLAIIIPLYTLLGVPDTYIYSLILGVTAIGFFATLGHWMFFMSNIDE